MATGARAQPQGMFAPSPSAAQQVSTGPAAPPAAQIVRVDTGETVGVHSAPGGPTVDRLSSPDQFGQPATLGVLARRGAWAAVSDPDLGNGHLGWIRLASRALTGSSTSWAVQVRRGARLALISHLGRVVRRIRVGIGGPDSPTPLGRFSITDKLPGARYSPVYGCCILALSAVQPQLPAGWRGGNRVAIHGTAPGVSAATASIGCIHASQGDLRFMMARLPAGTPVTVTR
jgi:lipoprotein-anchoring transpeptidase ErfK/SrfK